MGLCGGGGDERALRRRAWAGCRHSRSSSSDLAGSSTRALRVCARRPVRKGGGVLGRWVVLAVPPFLGPFLRGGGVIPTTRTPLNTPHSLWPCGASRESAKGDPGVASAEECSSVTAQGVFLGSSAGAFLALVLCLCDARPPSPVMVVRVLSLCVVRCFPAGACACVCSPSGAEGGAACSAGGSCSLFPLSLDRS